MKVIKSIVLITLLSGMVQASHQSQSGRMPFMEQNFSNRQRRNSQSHNSEMLTLINSYAQRTGTTECIEIAQDLVRMDQDNDENMLLQSYVILSGKKRQRKDD